MFIYLSKRGSVYNFKHMFITKIVVELVVGVDVVWELKTLF